MCPTVLGRLETRTATLIGPAILGTILALITRNEGFIVIIGILLLMGAVLDTSFYPYVIRWQPPWLTFVVAFGEFVILYTLAQILEVGLKPIDAVWFYWVSWIIANWTKIVILPIISLTWIESGGEFRQTGWSVAAEAESFPIIAMERSELGDTRLVREFSAVNELPAELRDVPAPSGVHQVPVR